MAPDKPPRVWLVTRTWRVVASSMAQAVTISARRPPDDVVTRRYGIGIEQERRDLMRENPRLYHYIEALVAARELDRAGGEAGGAIDGYGAANRVWARASRWIARRDALREDPEQPRRRPLIGKET